MWLIVAAAGVGGALSAAEPAGWLPADVLWRAAFAALVTASTAKAHRWTGTVLAGVAAVTAPEGWTLLTGLAALALALVTAFLPRRIRPLGALVGALAVQVLLRLDLADPGLATLVAAIGVAPVFISAYTRSRRRVRRVVHWSALAVVVFVGLAALGFAYATGRSQAHIRDGADAVRDGLDAVRANEPDRAVALLTSAAADFEAADRIVSTWGLPARVVPVLGHQARAVSVLTGEGTALAATAARATVEADTDELRFEDGVLDLDLVAGFEGPLEDAHEALAHASERVDEARTMWLVDPLATGVADFADEVDGALPEAELAIEGVRLARGLFGGEGERHYYVAFTQPAESRGLGGFVGNFGELTAVDGDVELTRSGRIRELIAAPGALERTLSGPADYLARYGAFQPAQFLQDLTFSPDGPSVGQVMAELYPQAGGSEVDGVIIVDPVALAALMNFTGPIAVEGLDEPLTADNAADFLIREQYLTFQEDEDERVDFLDEASEATFEALTQGDLPGPQQLTDVLGPVVGQGRLIVYSVHDDEQAFMERVGLDGALPPVDDGDFISLTTQNAANNKIDMFLERSVDYRSRWDPATGLLEATATIELQNTAPASGLPDVVIGSSDLRDLPPGTNLAYLSFYSPFRLTGATIGAQPVAMEAERERGRWVYSRSFEIPAGEALSLTLRLEGAMSAGETYRLGYAPQPLVNADRVRLRAEVAPGWAVVGAQGWERTADGARTVFTSDADEAFSLEVAPD